MKPANSGRMDLGFPRIGTSAISWLTGTGVTNPSAESKNSARTNLDAVDCVLCFLVPDRLAFVSARCSEFDSVKKRFQGHRYNFISSDLHLKYCPFAADFGPVNLCIVHRFCAGLVKKLRRDDGQVLTYCFQDNFEARSNASFLLGALMMLHYGRTPEEAAAHFSYPLAPFTLRPFRDATYCEPSYGLSLLDCLKGLAKAVKHGWYDMKTFDGRRYSQLYDPSAGDISEICPKFIAMKGPLSTNSTYRRANEMAYAPDKYVPALQRLGVTCVVRLNEPDTYDKRVFERAGIAHHDLYFDDCTTPPDDVVERFLDICDREGRVAVHCRAGLGRTGTLIALWLMKHAWFGADEAIGWLRIVRPGSVIGPQQQYLKACEGRGWKGNALVPADPLVSSFRPNLSGSGQLVPAMMLAEQVLVGMCAQSAARESVMGKVDGGSS